MFIFVHYIGAFIIFMAQNTRIKELLYDVKKMLEVMESRDKQYASHFETIE